VGGLASDLVSRSCFELDTNVNLLMKEPMRTGRFNVALALMSDRLIFTIGGCIAKDRGTEVVEVYDTMANVWYPVPSLTKARSGTSACSIGNRYLYVFPG